MDALQQEIERVRRENGGFNNGSSPRKSGKTDFNSQLMADEVILWEGEGESPKGVNTSDAPPKLFAIFWLGFSIFWTLGAFAGAGLMALFGVPFIIIGVKMLFSKPSKPHYAVTNKRVFTDVSGHFHITPYELITSARIQHDNDGTADIYFTVTNALPVYSKKEMYIQGMFFSKIEDGDRVYNIFENAVFERKNEIQNKINQ